MGPTIRSFVKNWEANFHGWNAADFGWGGDTTRNVLWRLEQGELEGVNPKVVVLMMGTNNLGPNPPADEVARGGGRGARHSDDSRRDSGAGAGCQDRADGDHAAERRREHRRDADDRPHE